MPFLTRVVTLLIRGGTDELLKNDKSLAREAREIMQELGPTYVKLGKRWGASQNYLLKDRDGDGAEAQKKKKGKAAAAAAASAD